MDARGSEADVGSGQHKPKKGNERTALAMVNDLGSGERFPFVGIKGESLRGGGFGRGGSLRKGEAS